MTQQVKMHIKGIPGSFVVMVEERSEQDMTLDAQQALDILQVLLNHSIEIVEQAGRCGKSSRTGILKKAEENV